MGVRRKYVIVLLAVGMVLFIFNLGGRDLWEPDETRYAVIPREKRVFVVIYPEALYNLNKETGVELCPIEQAKVGNWKYVLISNR